MRRAWNRPIGKITLGHQCRTHLGGRLAGRVFGVSADQGDRYVDRFEQRPTVVRGVVAVVLRFDRWRAGEHPVFAVRSQYRSRHQIVGALGPIRQRPRFAEPRRQFAGRPKPAWPSGRPVGKAQFESVREREQGVVLRCLERRSTRFSPSPSGIETVSSGDGTCSGDPFMTTSRPGSAVSENRRRICHFPHPRPALRPPAHQGFHNHPPRGI